MTENTENLEQEEKAKAEAEAAQEQEVSGENEEETSQAEESSESEDYKKKFFYLAAEMDNMKKRFDREKENLLKFGNEKVLSALVDVVDNLERTMSALDGDKDEKIVNIVKGVEMVRDQFLSTLSKHGLEVVESLNKPFDPNFHEAMAQQPAEGVKENTIIMEYQRGYILNGRLLRAAKVVVAKN